MLFKPELAQAIISGKKTQTRRPLKKDSYGYSKNHNPVFSYYENLQFITDYNIHTIKQSGRVKYQVERDYSVQYGYGKPTRLWHPEKKYLLSYDDFLASGVNRGYIGFEPLRIKITRLRVENVRNITHADAIAEGFTSVDGFLMTWVSFYDKSLIKNGELAISRNELWQRPVSRYQCVAIDFEVVMT